MYSSILSVNHSFQFSIRTVPVQSRAGVWGLAPISPMFFRQLFSFTIFHSTFYISLFSPSFLDVLQTFNRRFTRDLLNVDSCSCFLISKMLQKNHRFLCISPTPSLTNLEKISCFHIISVFRFIKLFTFTFTFNFFLF